MLVRVQHAVLSLPTGCGKGLRSRLVAALVLADPPSLREQSPESLRRLLLCFALVAELVYAVASKATVRKDVRVRFPLKARTVIGSSLVQTWVSKLKS